MMIFNPKAPKVASEIFDIHQGRILMFVICDVAAHSVVDDIETPLLRVCNTSGKDGEILRTIFTHPHYMPVARTNFLTIEINISDELGRPIPFMHGKTLVTLHFRQRNALIMNHFYITLPSDISENYFPDNTVAHFTSRLPHSIRLGGDYEVELAELIYPNSWLNFNNADNEMHAHIVKTESDEIVAMCSFPSGQYANETILAKGLTDKLAEVIVPSSNRKDLRVTFKYDDVFRKMTFTVRCEDDSEAFFISEDIRRLFGWTVSYR